VLRAGSFIVASQAIPTMPRLGEVARMIPLATPSPAPGTWRSPSGWQMPADSWGSSYSTT